MTPEQKQQRLEQILERWSVKTSNTKSWGKWPTLQSVGGIRGAIDDINFLLPLVEEQEAQRLSERILKTLDDAVVRVGCSANCYDVPADANSGAEYVAMRVRQVVLLNATARPATEPNDKVERFYFLDSHDDTAFVREADYERIVTSMRSACVEKVKSIASKYEREQFAEVGNQRIVEKIRLDTAKGIIKELESVSIKEQEK